MRIGSTMPLHKLTDCFQFYLKQQKFQMWPRKLQYKKVDKTNILLYSTPGMDSVLLCAELSTLIRCEINIRYGILPWTLKYNAGDKNYIRGFICETDTNESRKVKIALKNTYHHKQTDFSCHHKLCYLPLLTDCRHNPNLCANYQRLIRRQEIFCKLLVKIQFWEVTNLDFFDMKLKVTMRDILMSFKSVKLPTLSIFHSVDTAWKSSGIVFQMIAQMEEEG